MVGESLMQWVQNRPSVLMEKPPVVGYSPFSLLDIEERPIYLNHSRLGFVYQDVCAQLFRLSKTYHIEAEEIQLFDQKRTLGAIDFIIRNLEKSELEHWEVAVKFYLLHDKKWFGPNAADRLDIKLSRMLNHQLEMSNTHSFIDRHPNWTSIKPKLLMQGRLHINPFSPEPIPTHSLGYEIQPDSIDGFWCFYSQRHLITSSLYSLTKIQWTTGTHCFSNPIDNLSESRVTYAQTENNEFWFIVPDDWPNNVRD
ncbi:DUF1853 family protein [Vibrio tapetis]|uniref:Type II citrate synthase n=1 Tax=Vibrio tapetis subsp. tapetis TaxID=1671868 RepID=A0A2N8ZBJ0_9VIBR|nr:DUF1853 family protein [Vibrio tapetis]SON49253.1 conserved protein of unknown function [Vibrio tapetis subsp. tapetis]